MGYELYVIASAIIGGTALTGGSGSVAGRILGALLIAVIRNGLVLLEFSAYWGTVVTGAVIYCHRGHRRLGEKKTMKSINRSNTFPVGHATSKALDNSDEGVRVAARESLLRVTSDKELLVPVLLEACHDSASGR